MNQFNMDQIGRKISNLRREQNMTQMELADKLGISFQAVSNWERGNTMPDISKLPELAEIFHVTTDELLGEASGGLVRSAAKGEMEQYMEVNSVTVEEFVQVASLLSTVQAEAGFEKLTEQKTQLKLSDIEDILPFLGSDMVDELALKYMDSPEGDDLEDIARYASGPVLKQIAEKLLAEGKNIEDIARYLSTEDVDRAVLSYMETANWGYLEDIARYASGSVMEQAAEKLVAEGKNIEGVRESAGPFLYRSRKLGTSGRYRAFFEQRCAGGDCGQAGGDGTVRQAGGFSAFPRSGDSGQAGKKGI